jgi:predicted component of type VI protein secretion system
MIEKEKYRAEVEAKMTQFNETLNEIIAKQELRDWSHNDLNIGGTICKRDELQIKVNELKKDDSTSWETVKTEVDGLIDDIDRELSSALAYFS